MELRNNDLALREAMPSDARKLTEWWNDGDVMEHAGFPKGLDVTEEETRKMLEKTDPAKMMRLIIEVDEKPVGECSYRLEGHQAEIGIKLCETEYQNRGFGRKALRMMISHIFDLYEQVEKIVLDTDVNNKRSRHVYELLGFSLVAIRPDAWQDQLGAWRTDVDYELTRENFQL